MNAILKTLDRILRGPAASRILRTCGIDPVRYWLLMDLFGQLSSRREMLTQLGREGTALKLAAGMYAVMMGLLSILFVIVQPPPATYLAVFLVMTGFVLLSVLLSETGNSLVNPVEALVLAHQPIDGATYTAAKLSHLLRILLYFVTALSGVPALAGVLLRRSTWLYPLVHILLAFGVGLVIACFCCAVFGWLIRFVPAARLKAAGQLAEAAPWVACMLMPYVRDLTRHVRISDWLPAQTAMRWGLAGALGVLAVAVLVFGIRSLSGDYLVRVATIAHGGSGRKTKIRRSWTAALVSKLFGGPAGRAGFEYVSRMMLRDWQFRRQLIPLIPLVIGSGAVMARAFRSTPFSSRFSLMHLLPHVAGTVLFFFCTLLPYGSDYKGAWLFLLAPAGAFAGFARGVYAFLWLRILVLPHVILLCATAWLWGVRDAALFFAYSLAVASTYLGLELRLIDGVPFGKQPEAGRGAADLPVIALSGLAIGAAVAVQYFLVFRSMAAVILATAGLGAAAYALMRSSTNAFAISMRYTLGLSSGESAVLYKEIEV